MNIRPYYLKMLSRWEIFQLLTDVLSLTDKISEDMPQTYTDKLGQLHTAFNIYDIEVMQESKPSPKQLLKAEEGRDYAIRKIYQLIRYYSNYRFNTNKEFAAKKLLRIFKSLGTGSKISRENQDTQTAMITNLLQELALEDAKQHIATLDLTDAVAALTMDNLIFDEEQNTRKKYLSNYVKGVVKDARADAEVAFLEFVDVVNALSVVEGPDKYADLKRKITTYVHYYVTQAKQRNKKKVVEQ